MTHPTDLIADLVGGTLAAPDRDRVLTHVRGCPRCSAEVGAASSAREALRTLPAPVTPPGLGAPAVAAAREAAGAVEVTEIDRRRAAAPAWYRAAGAAGIAAVLVIAIAVALPRIGEDTDAPSTAAESAAADAAASRGPLTLEVLDQDFDLGSVRTLADEAAATAGAADTEFATGTDPARDGALGCLRRAFETFPGTTVRLIEARFDGEPAYLGVFLEGPGAGQPADTVFVLAASSDGCRALSSTRVQLPE